MSETPSPASRLLLRTLGAAMLALFGFMGAGAFWNGLRLLREGHANTAGAVVAVLLGAIVVGVTVFLAYWGFVGSAAAEARRTAIRARFPGQPWMERPEWASRRIVYSSGTPALLSWVWVAGWCGGIGLIATVNRAKILAELANSWTAWLVAGAFGLGTLVGLTITINLTRHWLRFGRSTLMLDTLPGRPGQPFRATLSAALPRGERPDVDVHLVCEAVHWVETRRRRERETRLHVDRLGEVSARIPGSRGATTAKGLVIPIEILVPEGLPDSAKDERGNGVQWRLEVVTPTGFSASFEVPVFAEQP